MNNKELNFISSIDDKMSFEDLKTLYNYGVTTIRLNMSYRLDYYNSAVEQIKKANQEYGINIQLMCDLAGTEMRVINPEPMSITMGQKIIVGKDLKFDQGDFSLLESNDEIIINDGKVVLIVEKYCDGLLHCISNSNSVINPNSNAYNSKIYNQLPFISNKDKLNLDDAIKYNADFIAVSHVRRKEDLDEIKNYLRQNNANIKLISKIENAESIENIDEIIENSDGIMIARGDLGKILPIHELGYNQKIITEKTLKANKYLISATDYLATLMENKTPTRAEVIDLFTAYNDGIKNIMFSKELLLSIDQTNFLQMANNIYQSYLKYKNKND